MSRYAVAIQLLILLSSATKTCVNAFAPTTTASLTTSTRVALVPSSRSINSSRSWLAAASEKEVESSSSAFVPLDRDEDDEDETDDALEKVELLGKGAAKAKRGKRKGTAAQSGVTPTKSSLAPEQVYYEGPPAITETIAPTLSILTVVGIIPAAAAWARQAWVRYKITNRRIRVTSGINGADMAEIVYPDIVELRTVKRLFGDGDMVAFLRDGAKFEMRNIPNFDDTIEFILTHVDPKVVATYRNKGDVTRPPTNE